MIDTKLSQIINKRNVDLSKLSKDYYINPVSKKHMENYIKLH